MSFTKMTAAMLEVPFRMFELPFLMSAAFLDAMFADRNVGEAGHRTSSTKRHEGNRPVAARARHAA